jgi:hypothetical protein
VQGTPVAKALTDAADEHEASLIVLGAHRKSGLGGRVAGSVAGEVASRSHRPVMIVHDEAGDEAALPVRLISLAARPSFPTGRRRLTWTSWSSGPGNRSAPAARAPRVRTRKLPDVKARILAVLGTPRTIPPSTTRSPSRPIEIDVVGGSRHGGDRRRLGGEGGMGPVDGAEPLVTKAVPIHR